MEASLLAEEMLLPFLCGDSRVFAGLEETGEVARSDNETYQPRETSPKSNRKVVIHTDISEDRTLMVAEDAPVYGKE